MGKQSPEPEQELYRRTDEVLHYLWDPIGVSTWPLCRDEYYSYLPHVFDFLTRDAGAGEIAGYLSHVRTEWIGCPEARERDLEIAEVLRDWKESIVRV